MGLKDRVMKAAVVAAVVVGFAASVLIALSPPDRSQAEAIAAGQKVDDFELTDQALMAHELYYYRYAPVIVLMSQTSGTKASQDNAAELQTMAATYRRRGVIFMMINSDGPDSRPAIQAEARARNITLPILIDEQQLVAESLGIEREGEVFVIEPKTMTLAWHGPLHAGGAAAIDAVLAHRPAPRGASVTTGKTIAYAARRADFANISYTAQIAPILQDKCVRCHLKDGIGPFAFDSYEVVKSFAPTIREVVRTRRMPPYFADPHIGHFKNDQGLSPDQAKALVHWIEAGAPRGSGPDPLLANRGKTAPDWPAELGKPDLVVDLPAFAIPASGLIPYRNFYLDNPFGQDTWLRAVATRPGDRRVLHHVISDQELADTGVPPSIPNGLMASYGPGAETQVVTQGLGAPVPAGGKLHFQMHYTTFGQAVTDHTQVGFYTLKTPPQFIQRSVVIMDYTLRIPAGEAAHKEVAYLTFPADAWLYSFLPHAHVRGAHVELKAKAPDGSETPLLVLPRYDFNWQRNYDPVEPILIKAGTKLVVTWIYDNSAHNRANPDPKRTVTFGEQTQDEMMYFRINYRWADETVAHPRNDIDEALGKSFVIGIADDNLNNRIDPSELGRATMAGFSALGGAIVPRRATALKQ